MEITEKEREALRSIGKKLRAEMVRKFGTRKLAEIARKQGKHGIKGGRPTIYKPCKYGTKATKYRHRFVKGTCRCGQEKLT